MHLLLDPLHPQLGAAEHPLPSPSVVGPRKVRETRQSRRYGLRDAPVAARLLEETHPQRKARATIVGTIRLCSFSLISAFKAKRFPRD